MGLEVGARLGHYDVTALIGEGGMGQVYQARDTKLDRDVALKVLPQAFTEDPDRLARFEREARVLASLNHPNIAAIHGVEESDGIRALVLELVEGPTLEDRIKQGPIPLDEALPIAKQIAEALEAAHEAGVIHRDLKPANIKVKEDGTVKVLDFGLAKALDPLPEGDASQSPTLTAAATQMGVIMGTAAYMSPEQARGSTVDSRADIWSFGVVLFEMLTGKQLFTGATISDTLAAVLKTDPDWNTLPGDTPSALRRVLHRCLERDRKERLPHVGEARFLIREAQTTPAPETAAAETVTAQPTGWQRVTPWVAGVVLGGVVVGLTVWNLSGSGPPAVPPTQRFSITPPASAPLSGREAVGRILSLSPDGRTLVYRGPGRRGRLHRRFMNEFDAVPVRDTESAIGPTFSPDGQWVAFYDDVNGPLKRVSLAGGSALTIIEKPHTRDAGTFATAWGADDTIVFADGGLSRVSANGGAREPLTMPESEGETHGAPHFLPGGSALLFDIRAGSATRIAAYSFDTEEWRVLVEEGGFPHYSLGHIVFSRSDSVWAVPFDAERLETRGDPFLVLESVEVLGGGQFPQFDVAHDGTIVYVSRGSLAVAQQTVDWVDRQGIATPLLEEPRGYAQPRFSPDGRRMLLAISDDRSHVWMLDVERGNLRPLTFGALWNGQPIWAPGGEHVTFSSAGRDEIQSLYQRPADGSGEVERLLDHPQRQGLGSWSRDGVLAFTEISPNTQEQDIWVLEDGAPRAFIATDAYELAPRFSPDGQWIAYESDESGQPEVYVAPYPGPGGAEAVSQNGGMCPVWSPDGRELFYANNRGQVLSVSVQFTPSLELGAPTLLFEIPNMLPTRLFDVHPDGERFVVVRSVDSKSSTSQINVVLNWTEELTDRVPVD